MRLDGGRQRAVAQRKGMPWSNGAAFTCLICPITTPFGRRGNFLYDAQTGMLNLIDFGAARDYPPHFVVRPVHGTDACRRGTACSKTHCA